jgi:hypothetical protein
MFEELYFWMTTRLAKIKSNGNPPRNAYLFIGLFQSFNVGTLFVILNYFLKLPFEKVIVIYVSIFWAILLLAINHFTLYAKRKEISNKFENMEPKRKKKGLIYFWLYVCLSTILFFVAAAYLVTPHYLQK